MAASLAAVLAMEMLGTPALAASGATLSQLDEHSLAPATAIDAPHTLYLDVLMDGRVAATLVRFRVVGNRLWVAPDALEAIGLRLPAGLAQDADGRVALADIPGLDAQFDPRLQRVTLIAGPQLRPTSQLGYRRPPPVEVTRDHGLVLDWDVFARSFDHADTVSLGTGARWFGRWGTLEVNGVSRAGDGDDDAYARLDTRWSYSDPRHMWTWSAGDVISGGLGWTRPVRLGGVRWRRDFGVRPDLIVYPLPRFSAEATLPSSVELFVNNVRQYSEDVAPGPFVLREFPRVVGAGQAVVVVTDALGRSVQTSVPLYVDYQRLARGLSDFSLEAGVLRRDFGLDSTNYGDDPVASGSWRRGVHDDVTVELHGEAGPDLRLGGAGLAWSPAGRYGVVTASYAHSGGDGDGHQAALGYQWFGQQFGFDFNVQRASAGYRDLGALGDGSPPLRRQDRASLWFDVPRGSLSLSWLRFRDAQEVSGRTVSVGLNQTYGRVSVMANAFDDDRAGFGVSLSVSVPLEGELYSSFGADRRDGESDFAASLRRNAPYEGGWGWQAQVRDGGDGQLAAQYRGHGGEVQFGIDRRDSREGAYGQGRGSLVLMDGQVFASRHINDAFAVVSSNGVADVPILYENREAGRTDENGYLLLSDLRGWEHNRLAIDPDGLPANFEMPALQQLVTPADTSGIRVRFALERMRAATVILHEADGSPVAPGTRVRRADGSALVVGFDGVVWLEDYLDGEALLWTRGGRTCLVTTPPLPQAGNLPQLGPLRCSPEAP